MQTIIGLVLLALAIAAGIALAPFLGSVLLWAVVAAGAVLALAVAVKLFEVIGVLWERLVRRMGR